MPRLELDSSLKCKCPGKELSRVPRLTPASAPTRYFRTQVSCCTLSSQAAGKVWIHGHGSYALSQATASSSPGNWSLQSIWIVWGFLKVWGCEKRGCVSILPRRTSAEMRCQRIARPESHWCFQHSKRLWFLNRKNPGSCFPTELRRERFLILTSWASTSLAFSVCCFRGQTKKEPPVPEYVHAAQMCTRPSGGPLKIGATWKNSGSESEGKAPPPALFSAKWRSREENSTRERVHKTRNWIESKHSGRTL